MRISRYVMPAMAIATLLGAVFTAKAVGAWQTSGRDMIDPTQPLTSADIRGWMPLTYLMERLDLTQAGLYELLGLPPDTAPETPLKDLEEVIEVSEVREILAVYLGEAPAEEGPRPAGAEVEAATPVPETAATQTAVGQETDHIPGSGDGTGVGPTPLPEGRILPAAEIKGRMTLREVSEQCAMPLELLYSELGLPDGASPGIALKDLRAEMPDLNVEAVREVVAAYQGR